MKSPFRLVPWLLVTLFLCNLNAQAQQITVTSITPNPVCAGATVTATYSYTLPDPGIVDLYLNGPNTTNIRIGVATTNGNNGSVTGTIPMDRPTGSYTVYVRRTSNILPTPINSPNSSAFTVNALPAAPGVANLAYCLGTPNVPPLTATGQNLRWYIALTGGTGSTTAPTPPTSATGTTNYYVSQTSASGCEGPRATLVVTITAASTQIAGPAVTTPVTLCQNQIATPLSATPAAGGSLNWYGPSNNSLGTTAPTPPTTVPGTTFYSVSQTINGCSGQKATITVTVNSKPTAPTTTPVSVCANTTPVSLAIGVTSGSNLQWYNTLTGGTASTVAPTPPTGNPGSTTYYVSQINGNGCESDRTPITFTVNPPPAAPVPTPSTITYCQNAPAQPLTATGQNLKWYSASNGGSPLPSPVTPTTSLAGPVTYYVSQTNANGCESDRASVTVTTVSRPAAPTVNSLPVTYCQNAVPASLTATPITGNTLNWYGPNATGGTASATPTVPATDTPGTVLYYVSQTDGNVCESNRVPISVTIYSKPATPVTVPASACLNSAPNSLAQSVTATGTLTWYTASMGGTGSTDAPTLSTSAVGSTTYYVSQVSQSGCESDRATITFTVNPSPTVSLGNDGPLTCTKPGVSLTASGAGVGGLSYRFSTGASQIDTGNAAIVTSAGVYSVTVVSGNGCSAVASTTVSQDNAAPLASLVSSGTLSCAVTSVTLTANAGPGLIYQFSSGATPVGTSNQAVVNSPGVYSVTVATGNGCSAVASVSVVQDNTTPVASLVSSGSLTCSVTSVTLTANPNGLRYVFSAGATPLGTSNQAVVNASGTYSVTVVSANGCSSVASTSVSQDNTAPSASLVSSGTLSCAVTSVTLTANPGGLSYVFSAGATQLGSSNQALVSSPGLYSVTVLSTNGCSAVQSLTLNGSSTLAAPDFFTQYGQTYPGGVQSVTVGQNTGSVTFQFSNCQGGTVNWRGQDGSNGTGKIIALTTQPGTLTYTGTCTLNACTSPPATATVTVNAANVAPGTTANANQTATVGTAFTYTVNAFTDETPASLTYTVSGLPAGLSLNAGTRVISGTPSVTGVSTVTVTATDPGSLSASTTFTITVSASAVVPTGPATLTITNVGCNYTNSVLSSVNFAVGYSNGTFTPALPDLFINGVTVTGKLGQAYTFNFDGNQSLLPIQDQATRTTYFVWDFRSACANAIGPVTPPAPTAPVAPALANQTATQGTPFSYVVPAFTGTAPIAYSVSGLPAGLSFEATSRTISGTLGVPGVSTVVVSASNAAGQSSGQFTLTVSASATQPTGPATLTITSFTCTTTNGALSSVDFVVGYSNGSFAPALSPLFIVGVTASGQLGQTYRFGGFDNNVNTLPVADNASRNTYFVWNFRQACAGPVAPPAPTAPVAPVLANQTAIQGTFFSYLVPAFTGTAPIIYSATGLPAGLSFEANSRTISGTPSLTGVSTVVISGSNAAGQSSGQFTLTVSASAVQLPVGVQPLTLVAPLYNCQTGSFTFQTSGGDGSAIEFMAVGITGFSSVAGPYTVLPAGDAQPFTLKARQSGVEVSYTWDFKAVCSGSSRVGVAEEVAETWTLRSVGNPVTGELVVEVIGAAGHSIQLELTDLNGHLVESRLIQPTSTQHRETFSVVRQGAGLLLMQATSGTGRVQTLKLLKR